MSNHRLIQKDHLILIAAVPTLIIASLLISIDGHFGTPKIAYSQSDPDQMNPVTTNSVDIQDIPLEIVRVGDIEIAYKMIGKGDPMLLISGAGSDMNAWEPSILRNLSSNHTIIVFDNRGIGNTTTGTKPFSVQQLANDTAGLLDALKIQKSDVLGYSQGSFVAQQLTIAQPENINRLILVASSCGGKESVPPSPQFVKFASDIVQKSLNDIPIPPQDIKRYVSFSLGSEWIKLHPDSLETIPKPQDLFAGIPPNTLQQQFNAYTNWTSINWSGICNNLPIATPTLVITGTDDTPVPSANSLVVAEKIPGAWLIQIKDAGHLVMSQYPDKVNKILQTFLSSTAPSA